MSDTKINRQSRNPVATPAGTKSSASPNAAPTASTKKTAQAPVASKDGFESTARVGKRGRDGFEARRAGSRPGVAGTQAAAGGGTAAATPGQPQKRTITLRVRRRPAQGAHEPEAEGQLGRLRPLQRAVGRADHPHEARWATASGRPRWSVQDDGQPRNWEWGVTGGRPRRQGPVGRDGRGQPQAGPEQAHGLVRADDVPRDGRAEVRGDGRRRSSSGRRTRRACR